MGKELRNLRILMLALLAVLSVSLCMGCGLFGTGSATTAETADGSGNGTPEVTTAVSPDVTTTDPSSGPSGDTTVSPDTTSPQSQPPETTAGTDVTTTPETTGQIIMYHDPLTGLEDVKDLRKVRPVALVIDNISSATPQSGISRAKILIETMVEGGISRLTMITNDYSGLEVFGPIRSTRPYMISLAQAYGTLMVGAGYSDAGYAMIKNGGLNYIDGTHDRNALTGFFRDVTRYQQTGYEHSLMITGSGILKLAALDGYPVATEGTPDAFEFASAGRTVVLNEGISTHVILPYSSYQQVQMIYSRTTETYYRYQYGDKAHLDAENGEQLNFTNVLVLFTHSERISGDTEGRLDVAVTGSGTGYYITGGRYAQINWSRTDDSSAFVFTAADGSPLYVNRGTTFITVMSDVLKSSVVLNYKVN